VNDTTDTTTTSTKRFALPIALKFSAASEAGTFSGFGSTFGGAPDSYGDVVAAGAFTKTIADHRNAGTSPALLWSHQLSEPIGTITQLAETNHGLRVDGKLALGVERGRDAYELMKMGALGLSIGYRPVRTTPNGKAGRILNEITLYEISAVSVPANSAARITSIKSRPNLVEQNDPRILNRVLLDAGFSRSLAKEITYLGKAAMRPSDMAFADQQLARKLIAAAAAVSPFSR
jgi:HK97 family phage prohead protease